MLGIDKVGVGDPLTDKLALGDPPQAVKTTALQITSEKYLFMAAGRKTAPIRTTKGRWLAATLNHDNSTLKTRGVKGIRTPGRLI
jgi:hypothetical protein